MAKHLSSKILKRLLLAFVLAVVIVLGSILIHNYPQGDEVDSNAPFTVGPSTPPDSKGPTSPPPF
ncbi:hypothetical protein KKG51_05130 [Patescibacteria group bacterium]|nr:hypothetical protein [Patescibacteria group bacterium]